MKTSGYYRWNDGLRDIKAFVNKPFILFGKIFGYKAEKYLKLLILISLIPFAIILYVNGGLNIDFMSIFISKAGKIKSSTIDTTIFQNTKNNQNKSPLEQERVKGIVLEPCDGHQIDIADEFSNVQGRESNIWHDPDDSSILSASISSSFQIAKIYPFDCSSPWIATLSAIPLNNKSIGLFLEFEDVFRIIIGDGDRLNWKIEENNSGRKEIWNRIFRQKLTYGSITTNRQITLIVKAIPVKGALNVNVKIGYYPDNKNTYIWEEREVFVQAKAIDLSLLPSHKFRVGINDFRYKGLGSLIKFHSFMVKEL